jgi:phosphoribosyl-AMP cyclohydrolase
VEHAAFLELVRYNADGLVPCVVQAAEGGEVLMVAYASEEALRATLATGEAHFWSRSRQELWHKGGTSGNVQHVLSVRLDCDHDTVLLTVEPAGPACHTGAASCFRDEASGGATTTPAAGGA